MVKIVFAALLLCVTLSAQENSAPSNASTPQQPQAVAQKSVQKKKATAQKSEPVPLPEYDVVLSPSKDVWTNLPDKFHPEVEGCDGSGNPYFSISGSGNLYLSITRSDDMQIVGLTPKGVVSFDAGKITDITSLHFVKSFIAPSDLYVLAIWIDPEKLEAKKGKEIDPVKDYLINGETRFYIVRFSLDGSYKKAHKLDFDFLPMQIAAFDGGNLLVAGLDKSNRAHVALLDSSGQLLNYLRLPKDVADDPKAASKAFEQYGLPTSGTDGTVPPETVAVFAAAFASVLPHKGSVLFSRAVDGRIYEIRNSGEIRMVKIKSSPNLTFEDKLQSDQDWFAYADNGLYRINPETGKLLGIYRVKSEGERQDQLACVYDGKFVGIRHAKGRLTLLTGVAELSAQQPQPPAQSVSK